MPNTGLAYHDRFLDHLTGSQHPERPDRLRAIMRGLESAGLPERLDRLDVARATDEMLHLVHSDSYIHRLQRACASGNPYIDTPDSAICPASEEIARWAVGAVLSACDAVIGGRTKNAFCAVRPPGHHARADRSAGFCLYNNVAIAARYLQRRHSVERIMILDWDVHHGDGTQEIFLRDPSVFFCSLHEDPRYCYPGTGYANERGEARGNGATLNIPMPPRAGDDQYRAAMETHVWPAARSFRPDFLLVSNGLDAHTDDPLAGIRLSDQAFQWLMQQARAMAEELCGRRLIAVLEGGYDLGVLGRCVPEQVRIMLEDGSES